jgi:serine/threonine protein kinase
MTQEISKEHIQPQSPLPIDYESLELLSVGGSGIVYAIDEGRVLKEFHGDGIDVERRALERLGSHPNIVNYLGSINNGLIFERGRPIRTILQQCGTDQISLHMKSCWLQEAAKGIRHAHENGIVLADNGCNNWIIVDGHLKLIDFEGCSIDGEEAGACYEWFSYKESTPAISQKTDIFAFGCAVYEVLTGQPPHAELVGTDDRFCRVQQLYAENRFPEVEDMPLRNLMLGCWHSTFSSMDDVLHEFNSLPVTGKPFSSPKGFITSVLDDSRSWMKMSVVAEVTMDTRPRDELSFQAA